MRFSDVKPSVFAPRRGGRRGGFPKGAALKSAPENPKKRAKYSLSRREARAVLYGARAPRAPVFAAVRGKGPRGHPPTGVRGSGPAVTIGTLGGGGGLPGGGFVSLGFRCFRPSVFLPRGGGGGGGFLKVAAFIYSLETSKIRAKYFLSR